MVWKRPVWDTIWAQFRHSRAGAGVTDLPFLFGEDSPDRTSKAGWTELKERYHYIATVHGFDAGGFEATIRLVDAQRMLDLALLPRGHRKPVEDRKPTDMLRAVARAKKTIRLAVKQIGCDHLLTLTTREEENDPAKLACQWKEFVRKYRKYSDNDFPYVAVPERHPSNPKHWHLHIAIRGRLKLNVARQLWWAICGGRGMGNVDVRYIKVGCDPQTGEPRGPLMRSEKIARYISKYITKDLIFAHRPDKKRYWRSEFDLPEARRYWLKTRPDYSEDSINAAFAELRQRFGGFSFMKCTFFEFPDGTGMWFSYNPDSRVLDSFSDPPPF